MADKVFVKVNEGRIRGFKKISSFSHVEYCCFLGVPYAQSTEEHNRFKDPVKIKPWNGVLDATQEKEGCRQFAITLKCITGSEDCLYNNIYTTKLPTNGEPLKPVIVNIHPGGFIFGSPDPSRYGSPEFIMHHDIVYVTIGYRIHILGFLNLGLKECSGNQGLKDIIMSLEWIKKNIHSFGGDPNNITVMGSSSGSAIVHFLMLSPRAKGLFHKAIMMGMHVLNPTLLTQRENVTSAFEIAKFLGYEGTSENRRKLLSFLKTVDIDTVILMKLESVYRNVQIPIFPASPFVPTQDQGNNAIVPLSPEELVPSTARIPLMVGFCDKEAAMVFTNEKYKNMLVNNLYSIVTQNPWGWGRNLADDDIKLIKKKSESFYLNGESTGKANMSDKCDIMTDIALSDVYSSLIDIVSDDHSPVYVYKFNYEGSVPKVKDAVVLQLDGPLEGTVHADDYCYWSLVKDYKNKNDYLITPKSSEMIETFTKLICTFAETGDPNYGKLNIRWEPSTVENPCYLRIDEKFELIDGKLNGKRMQFWENLKKEFAN
ncbi:esterase FE4-like [Planococcus citri]|uniref:esterase FE4-like n=1 Tax=Planococcus citri TaxID=170843 RepID=UPI0031F9126B